MTDIMILEGDCLAVLPTLAAESVQCVVTSPPFFHLRDYGHELQIGRETTPDEFVEVMVRVFREVRRVLKPDGVCFLNLGDTYSQGGCMGNGSKQSTNAGTVGLRPHRVPGMKPKQLLLIPARVALALQADGWIIRNDVIIAKRNPIPESVKDRCTRSHEHLFVLAKKPRYFWDCDAIREPASGKRGVTRFGTHPDRRDDQRSFKRDGQVGANARDVWVEPTHYHKLIDGSDLTDAQKTEARRALEAAIAKVAEGEIADFRMKIAGVHRQRQGKGGRQQHIERDGFAIIEFSGLGAMPDVWRASDEDDYNGKWSRDTGPGEQEAFRHESETRNSRDVWLESGEVEDVWWQTQNAFKEAHFAVMPLALAERCIRAGSRPGDTILDMFGGAGTTALAAQKLGRNAVLIELNGDYVKMAKRRLCLDSDVIRFSSDSSDQADCPVDQTQSSCADTDQSDAVDQTCGSSGCDARRTDRPDHHPMENPDPEGA